MSISAFRRSHHRVPVRCTVYFSNTGCMGLVRSGICLSTAAWMGTCAFRSGAQFRLLIPIAWRRVSIVVRSAQIGMGAGTGVGLRFLTVPPDDQRRLQQFVTGRVRERVL